MKETPKTSIPYAIPEDPPGKKSGGLIIELMEDGTYSLHLESIPGRDYDRENLSREGLNLQLSLICTFYNVFGRGHLPPIAIPEREI